MIHLKFYIEVTQIKLYFELVVKYIILKMSFNISKSICFKCQISNNFNDKVLYLISQWLKKKMIIHFQWIKYSCRILCVIYHENCEIFNKYDVKKIISTKCFARKLRMNPNASLDRRRTYSIIFRKQKYAFFFISIICLLQFCNAIFHTT